MAAVQAFRDGKVAQVFDAYPPAQRRKLLRLRGLIYTVAAGTDGVGPLEETLKWGQPAYLTPKTQSGSTIRLGLLGAAADSAMFFNCQTTLVSTFKSLFPSDFEYSGNRAMVFSTDAKLPVDALVVCIKAALTYHRDRASAGKR
jgi:Domain of unknown function (DU1801)